MLIFQVDLFSSRGALPRDIQDVMSRQKDITYASRTRYNTDVYRLLRKWKTRTYNALSKVPDDQLTDDERKLRDRLAKLPNISILHLIYQQQAYEGASRDHEFSATSMREHWRSGYTDTKRTLSRRDWLSIPPDGTGVVVRDVHRERDLAD
jgi:NTE family protein